jgi:hypothetical protein
MALYPLERALRELGIQPILAPTGTPAPGKGARPGGCACTASLPTLYLCDAILERLAQDFQDVACALRPFIQKERAVVCQRHFPGHRQLPAADQPDIRDGVTEGATRHATARAVQSPVRPATRWVRVVSIASRRVIAGRVVASRCAGIDFPARGGPSHRTLWSERRHHLRVYATVRAAVASW